MINKKFRPQHKNKQRSILQPLILIVGGVIIIGGIFFAGWALAIGIQKSETTATRDLSDNSYLPEVPRISVEAVKAKLDTGSNVVIIDSRSKAKYESSHIPGAVSMPLDDMSGPYDELTSYDEIVIYCD